MPKKKTKRASVVEEADKVLNGASERLRKVALIFTSITTIFVALGGFGTWMVSAITEHTEQQITELRRELTSVKTDVKDVQLAETRLQLLMALNTTPDDEKTILDIARVYFIELKGDWYMTPKFIKWAKEHNIDITAFKFAN